MVARHIVEGLTPEAYMEEMGGMLGPELTNSYRCRAVASGLLLNCLSASASRKPALQEMMTEMIASKEAQENLHSPLFMARTLLF